MVVHFWSLFALSVADEIIVLKQVHIVETSGYVLLILRANISDTGSIDTLWVSILLLMLGLLELIVEGLELMRLFIYAVSWAWGALEGMVAVLENVTLVLGCKGFLCNWDFWTKSV